MSGGEQGLLSLAFDPDYETNRLFYVDYTDTNGDTRVVEYQAGGPAPVRRRELLFVDQPYANHNGGQLAFGPDGRLYVGMGDGGGGGDPENRAQNLDEKLGKLLSLDVDQDVREKDWTIEGYGLRNPWRFSFDRETGDLWIGDVGQGEWEEIDYTPATARASRTTAGTSTKGTHGYEDKDPNPAGHLVMPVHEYSHDEGCSVTGGYVYRGERVPAARRPLLLRGLLQRHRVEPCARGRQGSGRRKGRQDRSALARSARTPPASSTRCLSTASSTSWCRASGARRRSTRRRGPS